MRSKYKVGQRVLVSWRFNNMWGHVDPGVIVEIEFINGMFRYLVEDQQGARTSAPEIAISMDNPINRVIARLFK